MYAHLVTSHHFLIFHNFRGTSSAGAPDLGGELWERVNG